MKLLIRRLLLAAVSCLLPAVAFAHYGSFASGANGCDVSLLSSASAADCGSIEGHWKVEVSFEEGKKSVTVDAQQNSPGSANTSGSINGTVKVTRVITQECLDDCKATADLPTKTSVTFSGVFSGTLTAALQPAPGGQDALAQATPSFSGPTSFDNLETLAITQNDSAPFEQSYTSTVELGEGTYNFSAGATANAFVPSGANGGSKASATFALSVGGGGGDFSIPCVPEPSTVALGALGLGMLVLQLGRARRTRVAGADARCLGVPCAAGA
ncbi:PEP-CTERM sorting domain-containing protein [Caldimonas brevitalea]|uniref:Ice-binding protein C-terminal domain-containing protein n=1 Tax=Caldimonas brevitalea TaxID=413882 RepID=A0A0G3BL64_9BURK|nr:PEP-CTERM sorting domain-containing protein [Caldimonas brevitalea]AKJ30199.1 hypothetical protein AAW51_3508 [Caldimonas brevitalea]